MAFVMYVGYLLAKKQYRLTSLTHGYLPLLCILGITALLLFKTARFWTSGYLMYDRLSSIFHCSLPNETFSHHAWKRSSFNRYAYLYATLPDKKNFDLFKSLG